MRKFIEKRIRYYDDGDCSETWLAGFHDPTQPVTVDAIDPVSVTTSEKTHFFERDSEHGKSFVMLIHDGVTEHQFTPRDVRRFEEITEIALDKEEDRRANSPPPMADKRDHP